MPISTLAELGEISAFLKTDSNTTLVRVIKSCYVALRNEKAGIRDSGFGIYKQAELSPDYSDWDKKKAELGEQDAKERQEIYQREANAGNVVPYSEENESKIQEQERKEAWFQKLKKGQSKEAVFVRADQLKDEDEEVVASGAVIKNDSE
ncbi:MAG: hypothetical protein AAB875_04415 [Patescibacteria group bacterium]